MRERERKERGGGREREVDEQTIYKYHSRMFTLCRNKKRIKMKMEGDARICNVCKYVHESVIYIGEKKIIHRYSILYMKLHPILTYI